VAWVLLAASLLAPAAATAAAPGREDPLLRAIERIHVECLRAHPPDILAHVTAGRLRAIRGPEDEARALAPGAFHRNLAGQRGDYHPSALADLLPALQRVVGPGTRFLDLGSGDGRVVFLARLLGAHATGIEFEPRLVQVGLKAAGALAGLIDPDGVRFIEGDFFGRPWDAYDVVFYVERSNPERARLDVKLVAELAPGARFLLAYEERPPAGLILEERVGVVSIYRRGGSPRGDG
jgi:SAM-dependent methyltransferase